jgi:hypothetical protein
MAEKEPTEIELLRERADKMGIKYHPSSGVASLKEKIEEIISKTTKKQENTVSETIQVRNSRLKKEAHKLIRINITCMNPNKKDWPGEIISVANSVIGEVKKFIPFDVTEGYHVPQIIFDVLKERQCQVFYSVTLDGGQKIQKGKLIKEFNIEVLPPLTKDELTELARKQAITNSVNV